MGHIGCMFREKSRWSALLCPVPQVTLVGWVECMLVVAVAFHFLLDMLFERPAI